MRHVKVVGDFYRLQQVCNEFKHKDMNHLFVANVKNSFVYSLVILKLIE